MGMELTRLRQALGSSLDPAVSPDLEPRAGVELLDPCSGAMPGGLHTGCYEAPTGLPLPEAFLWLLRPLG